MKKLNVHVLLKILLPIIFGFAVFLFFSRYYRFHLHYEEQLQMFLFTSDYWWQMVCRPAGLTDYIGTFFTQFYFISWLGALIIVFLLLILQQQVSSLSNKIKRNDSLYPLTFIPSLLITALLCNENFLLSGLIAIIITLFCVHLYSRIPKPLIRIIYLFIVSPVLFWISGGIFWIFSLLCILLEWIYFKNLNKRQWSLFLGTVLFTVFSPVFFKYVLTLQYPLSRLWWGLCYSRYPVVSPYSFLAVWLSVPAVMLSYRLSTDRIKSKLKVTLQVGLAVLIGILGIVFVNRSADFKKEEIMAYDYFSRVQDWKNVIALANHKDPDSPLSVACLNMSLSKTGTMGDAMFRYFQNGPEGLLPSFQRDFTSPFITGEIYYHLGFLNTSMRYNFEAMEAIPDYKKSGRAIKRMAEVNLLNGEYKVAEKYLNLLKHTCFYHEWALDALRCIANPELIETQHSEWAELKKYRLTEDFLFSEKEKDQMLGMLFSHNMKNKMAYEYLMAYTLLTKDMEHFIQYFPFGKELGYKEVPAHYQEALILYWASKSPNIDDIPWPVSEPVKQYFSSYVRAYSAHGGENANPQSMNEFSQTYWYYNHFRK